MNAVIMTMPQRRGLLLFLAFDIATVPELAYLASLPAFGISILALYSPCLAGQLRFLDQYVPSTKTTVVLPGFLR